MHPIRDCATERLGYVNNKHRQDSISSSSYSRYATTSTSPTLHNTSPCIDRPAGSSNFLIGV